MLHIRSSVLAALLWGIALAAPHGVAALGLEALSEPETGPVIPQSHITEQEIGPSAGQPHDAGGGPGVSPSEEPSSEPVRSEKKPEAAQPTEGPRPSETREAATSDPAAVPPSLSLAIDERSLLAKITPQMLPRAAVSLRLAEEGRRLLESGQYEKGLSRLEKAVAMDAGNPYAYYFLAKAHYHLARYPQSMNFLDVAETLFAQELEWRAPLFALRGQNYEALGLFSRADLSYAEALKLDPNNRVALEGMSSVKASEISSR